jgi:broad specificity phosphatase PhoE
MTQLILARHGETDWNREGRYQGQADPPLNAAGQSQAEILAERLAGQPLEAAYSSNLRRALQTARAVARVTGVRLHIDPRLREVNQGEWEGMLATEIAQVYPAEWAACQRDPVHGRPPGGESVEEVAGRVWAAVDDILGRHPVGPVLIVSHALALATLRCHASGVPLAEVHRMALANGSLLRFEWPVGKKVGGDFRRQDSWDCG